MVSSNTQSVWRILWYIREMDLSQRNKIPNFNVNYFFIWFEFNKIRISFLFYLIKSELANNGTQLLPKKETMTMFDTTLSLDICVYVNFVEHKNENAFKPR